MLSQGLPVIWTSCASLAPFLWAVNEAGGELHSLAPHTRMSKHRSSYPAAVSLSVMEPKGENLLLEGSQVDDR